MILPNKSRAKYEGDWINEATVLFVDEYSITHIQTAQKLTLNSYAFVTPEGSIVYPSKENTASVVEQYLRWEDDGRWASDEEEDEEILFNRFILSERAGDAVTLLNNLLNSQHISRYNILRGKQFVLSIDELTRVLSIVEQ